MARREWSCRGHQGASLWSRYAALVTLTEMSYNLFTLWFHDEKRGLPFFTLPWAPQTAAGGSCTARSPVH